MFHCRRAYWNELLFPARGKSSHLETESQSSKQLFCFMQEYKTDLWMPELVSFKVEVAFTPERMHK